MAGSNRVLVVDDDAKIVKVVSEALRQEGYTVFTAGNGEAGMQMARTHMPHLIILDVMMPGLDGLEVCGRLRAAGSQVPILILSAKGDETDRVVGFRLGADDYLTKPFSISELMLRVKAILRRVGQEKQATAGDRVVAGDLEIDRTTRKVTMRGKELDLTPREFEMLWLFATHPGHVFSREVLLERLWESDFDGDASAVAVYMRRLREKIERNPSEPDHLKTVWGIGYKFEL